MGMCGKTRVYIEAVAMGKKTQGRFHTRHLYIVYPCLYYIQLHKEGREIKENITTWQK
jgi:hypothetical protein